MMLSHVPTSLLRNALLLTISPTQRLEGFYLACDPLLDSHSRPRSPSKTAASRIFFPSTGAYRWRAFSEPGGEGRESASLIKCFISRPIGLSSMTKGFLAYLLLLFLSTPQSNGATTATHHSTIQVMAHHHKTLLQTLAPPKQGQGTTLVSWMCHKCHAINAPTMVACANAISERVERLSAGKKLIIEQTKVSYHHRCEACVATYGSKKL